MLHLKRQQGVFCVSCSLYYFIICCNGVFAATYYVATNGNDSRTKTQAQNISTPWKTLSHAAGEVASGDTVLVRGGVYCEEVVMESDGVTWQAYPGEVPIIDGSVELDNPVPIQDANDFLGPDGVSIKGQFAGNPNWQHIYKVTFPVSDTSLSGYYMYKAMILENNELMAVASLPEQPNNVFDVESTFIPVNSACIGEESVIITSGRSEPDDYWNGAAMVVYLSQNNTVVTRYVEDWDKSTQTFTLSDELPYTITSQYRYKLENHWGCLTRPGEFYVSRTPVGGTYTAYVWPQNGEPDGTTFRIAKYDTGWEVPIGEDDNITIDGFTVQNFCGVNTDTSFGMGRRLSTYGTTAENLTIKNCTVRNIEGKIAITLGNVQQCLVENCTVENIRTGWAIFARGYGSGRCEDVVIRNCSVDWCRGTNYKFTETDYGQFQNCSIGRSGTHGNGIAIYENCNNIGIFHCRSVNSSIGLAYQACTNLYVIGNDFQNEIFSMAHWEAPTGGDMIFLNNTMVPGPLVSDLLYNTGFYLWVENEPASSAHYVVKNNIFWSTNSTIPSDYTTAPNTFDNASNCFLQTSYHWPYGPGSFKSTRPRMLFTDWDGDVVRNLTIQDTDADIYYAGVNVSDVLQNVEQVFAGRGADYAYDLDVDRRGTPWSVTPSIGAYEYADQGTIYNATQQRFYSTIQQAIQNASNLEKIIVYPGTYSERVDFQGKSISLSSFEPYNQSIVETTVIDAGQSGRAVTFDKNEDPNALLAGFTITGGYLPNPNDHGAGVYCNTGSPSIERCRIINNYTAGYGGGVYTANSVVAVTNCDFIENQADLGGGGVMNDANSITTICESLFIANETSGKGGGLFNDVNSLSKVLNCVFTGNTSSMDGGGVYNDANSISMYVNCTFSNNAAQRYGGGMVNINYSEPNISNCIFWDNTASTSGYHEIYNDSLAFPLIRCSDIAGSGGSDSWNTQFGINDGNNIDANPLFVDPDGPDDITGTMDDDLRLLPGSPCIDLGHNHFLPLSMVTDAGDRLRFVGRKYIGIVDSNDLWPVVDIGAYEYACEGNVDGSPDVTLSDFAIMALNLTTENCGYCNGIDLTDDGYIDMNDIYVIAAHWLCGTTP